MNVVFLIGNLDSTARDGQALTRENMRLLQRLTKEHNLNTTVVVAVQEMKFAGREKNIKLEHVRAERDRVVAEIKAANPELVICFGRTAASAAFNRGSVVLAETARQKMTAPDFDAPVVVIDSLSRLAAQPGIEEWIEMDVHAAINGWTETQWGKYHIINEGDEWWDTIPPALANQPMVGFDLETYPGTDPWHPNARIRMAVLSVAPHEAYLVQCPAPDVRFPKWMIEMAADPDIMKGGSFIAFDVRWMDRYGYVVRNVWDTSVAEHLINETNPKKDLKNLTFKYAPWLGDYSKGHRDLVAKRGGKKDGWANVEDHEMYNYTGGDGEASFMAMYEQRPVLDGAHSTRLAMTLYPILTQMFIDGAAIDEQRNAQLDQIFSDHLMELREEIQSYLGPINPASPKALINALKDNIKGIDLSPAKLSRALSDEEDDDIESELSTNRKILEREAHKSPVIALLLEHRKWHKLYGTYVKGMREKHMVKHGGNWFVHSTFNQNRVETNRLSSSSPNVQNIPRKPKEGDPPELNVKTQFISRFKGGHIIEADYSQAELRVAANESGDPGLIAAFNSGRDVHKETAALLLRKDYDDITDDERQRVKTLNFLIVYGGGANTLAAELGISKEEAKALMDQYFRAFPRLKRYIALVHARVQRDLRVVSGFGFTRRFSPPPTWNEPKGWAIKRKAFNHIIQNTAAAMTYISIIEISKAMKEQGFKTVLFSTVHDSLLFDVYPGEEDRLVELVKRTMENIDTEAYGYTMNVPLVADIEIGVNWGEKKEWAEWKKGVDNE